MGPNTLDFLEVQYEYETNNDTASEEASDATRHIKLDICHGLHESTTDVLLTLRSPTRKLSRKYRFALYCFSYFCAPWWQKLIICPLIVVFLYHHKTSPLPKGRPNAF